MLLLLGCGLFKDDFMEINPFGPGLADSTHYSIEKDPKVLEIKAKLSRRYASNGNYFNDVRVNVSKGLFNNVLIKEGSVKINGKQMEERQEFLTNTPVYYSDDVDWKNGSKYLIIVTLSDGKSYACSLNTYKSNITKFSTPSKANINNELTVSWTGNNPLAELRISCSIVKANNLSFYKGVDIDDSSDQVYTFLPGYFNSVGDTLSIKEVTLSLISRQYGEISNEFKNGSEIYSELIIEKLIKNQ